MAHHFDKSISLQLVALFWLLSLPMAVESVDLRSDQSSKPSTGSKFEPQQVPHAMISGKSDGVTILAQSDRATIILPPWSDRDVRQGTREAVKVIPPRSPSNPEAFPTDLRRSSAPNKDAIPLIQRTHREKAEDISSGTRTDETAAGGSTAKSTTSESFMTVHPFSDVDVRLGSRRQQNPATQPVTTIAKPATETPVKEQKGFFGRMLEKVGF